MCWKCDHPEATTQDWLELLYERVKEDGWTPMFVEDDRRPFAYTIGLHERQACPSCWSRGCRTSGRTSCSIPSPSISSTVDGRCRVSGC